MVRTERKKYNVYIKRSQSRGESMIMVAVMLMVFMILGAAVLTAASTTTAGASARIAERQAYYYARSMLDVLDESMRTGELGKAVRDRMMQALVASNTHGVQYKAAAPLILTYAPSVENAPLNEMTFSDVIITVAGKAQSATVATGAAITKATLQLRTVDLDFAVGYRGQTTQMHIQYRCMCSVEDYGTAPKWTQTWTIQQVG